MQPTRFTSIGLFGTGVMANGIAALCLANGLDVVLQSNAPERADALRQELLQASPEAKVSTDIASLSGCQLLLEATVEDLAVKREALSRLEPHLPADAFLATTTSSLSVTELAAALATPERMVGVHFFNPVHRMPLVEIVAGVRTSPEAVEAGRTFAHALGKRPLRVPDRAGFLVNRLLIPYLNQAVRLTESGYASPADIDLAITLGAQHPLGPFALIDLIGADVCEAISASLFDEFHRPYDAAPPELKQRVRSGMLGRKTGHGYYDYPAKPKKPSG